MRSRHQKMKPDNNENDGSLCGKTQSRQPQENYPLSYIVTVCMYVYVRMSVCTHAVYVCIYASPYTYRCVVCVRVHAQHTHTIHTHVRTSVSSSLTCMGALSDCPSSCNHQDRWSICQHPHHPLYCYQTTTHT